MTKPWFGVYLPQIRMSFDRILERTLAAEAAGFDSVWLMDHFAAPMAREIDTFEAWTVATALAARTSRPVRPVPPPGVACQDGRFLGRHLEWASGARHRLGIGARRAAHVRL